MRKDKVLSITFPFNQLGFGFGSLYRIFENDIDGLFSDESTEISPVLNDDGILPCYPSFCYKYGVISIHDIRPKYTLKNFQAKLKRTYEDFCQKMSTYDEVNIVFNEHPVDLVSSFGEWQAHFTRDITRYADNSKSSDEVITLLRNKFPSIKINTYWFPEEYNENVEALR